MITQISFTLHNPKKSANILAELTNGKILALDITEADNAFQVEFGEPKTIVRILPDGMIIHPTQDGAQFKQVDEFLPYGTTHFRILSNHSKQNLNKLAAKFGCHTYEKHKGSDEVLEFWVEEYFLVEVKLSA